MKLDLLHVLLYLSIFFIACQVIGAWIDGLLDRASEQIAERDSDWRRDLPSQWQTPATRHLGKTAVGIDREAA